MDRLLNILRRFKKIRNTGDLYYIYKNESNKACFLEDASYTDSKDLAKGTVWDKILKDRTCKNALNLKYDEYQKRLASIVYRAFGKKTGSGAIAKSKTGANINVVLAQLT